MKEAVTCNAVPQSRDEAGLSNAQQRPGFQKRKAVMSSIESAWSRRSGRPAPGPAGGCRIAATGGK